MGNRHFEYTGRTFKQKGSEKVAIPKKVKCIELDKEFDSCMEAARYMASPDLWACAVKTAKLRISDIITGKMPSYKKYSFKEIN